MLSWNKSMRYLNIRRWKFVTFYLRYLRRGESSHKDNNNNTVESLITPKKTCQLLIYTPSQWYSYMSRPSTIMVKNVLDRCPPAPLAVLKSLSPSDTNIGKGESFLASSLINWLCLIIFYHDCRSALAAHI